MNIEPATEAQKYYILTLARKSNIHDNTLSDVELKSKINLREGINIDELTKSGASAMINKYKNKLNFSFQRAGLSRKAY